jgi:hypothetical protein
MLFRCKVVGEPDQRPRLPYWTCLLHTTHRASRVNQVCENETTRSLLTTSPLHFISCSTDTHSHLQPFAHDESSKTSPRFLLSFTALKGWKREYKTWNERTVAIFDWKLTSACTDRCKRLTGIGAKCDTAWNNVRQTLFPVKKISAEDFLFQADFFFHFRGNPRIRGQFSCLHITPDKTSLSSLPSKPPPLPHPQTQTQKYAPVARMDS